MARCIFILNQTLAADFRGSQKLGLVFNGGERNTLLDFTCQLLYVFNHTSTCLLNLCPLSCALGLCPCPVTHHSYAIYSHVSQYYVVRRTTPRKLSRTALNPPALWRLGHSTPQTQGAQVQLQRPQWLGAHVVATPPLLACLRPQATPIDFVHKCALRHWRSEPWFALHCDNLWFNLYEVTTALACLHDLWSRDFAHWRIGEGQTKIVNCSWVGGTRIGCVGLLGSDLAKKLHWLLAPSGPIIYMRSSLTFDAPHWSPIVLIIGGISMVLQAIGFCVCGVGGTQAPLHPP